MEFRGLRFVVGGSGFSGLRGLVSKTYSIKGVGMEFENGFARG